MGGIWLVIIGGGILQLIMIVKFFEIAADIKSIRSIVAKNQEEKNIDEINKVSEAESNNSVASTDKEESSDKIPAKGWVFLAILAIVACYLFFFN